MRAGPNFLWRSGDRLSGGLTAETGPSSRAPSSAAFSSTYRTEDPAGFLMANLLSESQKPGTDRTASEFPAKVAGNPWQSCQSPGALHSTQTSGTLFPVVGLLTPPIFSVMGRALPFRWAPG